jgi:Rho-binding antiterminator
MKAAFWMLTCGATMTDYKPIPCTEYDVYEIAIMHGRKLRLIWREANVIYWQIVKPLDLETRNGEEFLIFRAMDEKTFSTRLDHIRKIEPA